MRSARIRLIPPLSACMRVGFTTFAVVLVTILVTNLVLLYFKGQPIPSTWLERGPKALGVTLGLGAFLGLVIYLIGLVWGATLTPKTLQASTLYGRKVEIPWSSITKIQPYSMGGLPALMVQSTATTPELFVYTLGLNIREVHDRLLELVGPENPLLIWLVPRAA